MDTEAIALTAKIDQAYEGTKQEAAEMVTLVRSQIAEGMSRESIITAHMLYLTMRYNASELATLIALLTYENAKSEA